ncbi:TlpA family protein disulfide reductase [Pedobacter jamesrossensis]|uniref:TlpA family protein disulfide reductase n=1 Tax=Pedobacter jamesrossensis TaxID=1908238 RepID=A0ABV8NRQ5_9SPHI
MKKTIFFIARALPCFFFMAKINKKGPVPSNLQNNIFEIEDAKTLRILSAVAYCELKFERLSRKRAFRILFIAMILTSNISHAQNNKSGDQLEIGDKIPTLSLSNVINYSDTSVMFSTFKGKAVILDFWATYCSPCIAEFPKMDAMQKHYGKNIQFLLINTYPSDTREALEKFLIQQKSKITDFSLPMVISSTTIREMFPIKTMPHYIWVGADGRIKAITRADQLTDENVAKLVAGLSLNLQIKKD